MRVDATPRQAYKILHSVYRWAKNETLNVHPSAECAESAVVTYWRETFEVQIFPQFTANQVRAFFRQWHDAEEYVARIAKKERENYVRHRNWIAATNTRRCAQALTARAKELRETILRAAARLDEYADFWEEMEYVTEAQQDREYAYKMTRIAAKGIDYPVVTK
jgi:hypothetical protein